MARMLARSQSSSPAGWEVSCGTRRHEARPGYVRLLKVWGDTGAEDPRLDPQALSELQGHPLPQGETLEVTLTRFFDAQEHLSGACGRAAALGLVVYAALAGGAFIAVFWLGAGDLALTVGSPLSPLAPRCGRSHLAGRVSVRGIHGLGGGAALEEALAGT